MIYFNDLTEGLLPNVKLFVDDTCLSPVILNIQTSANNLNEDLERISKWATQWKINFNPATTKQAQEVIFSRKFKKRFILHYNLIMSMLLGHFPKTLGDYS